jgi:hypothetical protein
MTTIRISHWLWMALLIAASATLYHTSYQVQQLEQRIAKIKAQQVAERENIHVLQTEWAALTAPLRLQRLADKYLPLEQVTVAQIVPEHRLSRVLPRRDVPDTTATNVAANNAANKLAFAALRGADGR